MFVCFVVFLTAYKKEGPFFDDVLQPDSLYPPHYVRLCKASISGDAHLEWRTDMETIPFPDSGEYNLSSAVLDRLCRDSMSDEPISILLESSSLTNEDGSVYLSEKIALVICNGYQSRGTAHYTCYSSDSSGPGPSFVVRAGVNNNQVVTITVPIAIFIVILLIVLVVVVVVFVYPYYSRLKAEPPRMCPIDHASATAGLVATSPDFEENYSSHLEFPRENLVFVKVLGKLAIVWLP